MNWYLNNRKTVVRTSDWFKNKRHHVTARPASLTSYLYPYVLYNQSQEIIENSLLKHKLNAFIDVLQDQAAQSSNKIDVWYEIEVFLNL